MCYSIDEIYNLFIWDNQLSDEENELKTQKGIDAAKRIQNLFPFIQPIVLPPEKSKSVWEPCAKVVAMRSDEELLPFIFMLLEWVQNLNWPGAMIIYKRLTRLPYSSIEFEFRQTQKKAEQANDLCWLSVLDDLYKDLTQKT